MADIEKGLIAMVIGLVVVLAMVEAVSAMQPQPQYACPVCDAVFFTEQELYNHFTTEHPAYPIDIIWN